MMRTRPHKKRYPIAVAVLSTLLAISGISSPSWAGTTLEQIQQTGILRAGTRTDALPFAYVNAEGEWVGFSIDLLERIRMQLEQELSRPVQLELVEVTPRDRLSSVAQGEVDLVCESASFTFNRSRFVDFSIGFFKTGTQFLVRRDVQLNSGEFRVGIIPSSTNASAAQGYLRVAEFVRIPDRATGVLEMDAGRIDALASDGILLEGMRQSLDDADTYALIPQTPIAPEVYSCILQQDNLDFREIVDRSLVSFMSGFLNNNPPEVAIFDRWFGDDGVVPSDRDFLQSFFQETVESYQERLNNQQPDPIQEEPDAAE
ncbi:amino acid ABC transporter substrate-binding protein [Egbenema bharatensis]|uniref:amino acid ABC transporter substrate-binding protein n=1 Tax=Egbenema bharatensis TaxID=3463334 RepID=UPI003A85FB12